MAWREKRHTNNGDKWYVCDQIAGKKISFRVKDGEDWTKQRDIIEEAKQKFNKIMGGK